MRVRPGTGAAASVPCVRGPPLLDVAYPCSCASMKGSAMSAGNCIMLCATQRTGSSMIFDDLLNLLGHSRADGELLYTTIIRNRTKQSWQDAWPSIREMTTFGDMTINKVMFHYVAHLSGFIAGVRVERPRPVLVFDPERFEDFHLFFRDAIWVYVERLDVFAQAVSMYLAEATDVWERLPASPDACVQSIRRIPYNREILKDYMHNFLKEREGWCNFFKYYNIDFMKITYEDAVANYPDYLFELLARVGAHVQVPYPERRMLKLGDALNDRFAAQLRDDVLTELYIQSVVTP